MIKQKLDLNLIFGLELVILSNLLFYVKLYGVGGRGISQWGLRSETFLYQVDLIYVNDVSC